MFDRIKGWITERSQANIYEVRGTKMFNEFRKVLNRIKKTEWMTEGLEWFMLEPQHSLVIAHSFNECFSSSTVRGVNCLTNL